MVDFSETKWMFPIEQDVDYRLPENRLYMVKAWAEAMYRTGELNQQLRLMNHAIENGFRTPSVIESKLWLAFLWGCCYNFTGPWVILNRFPVPPKGKEEMDEFASWYNDNWNRIRFDTDCRYRRGSMIECVQSYVDWLEGGSQYLKFSEMMLIEDPQIKYDNAWAIANSWKFYGRLSSWNYLEALALVSDWKHDLDCQSFLLTDVSGSESNRNGVAFIINREDLITKHGKSKETGVRISLEDCMMLEEKAQEIFNELVQLFNHIDPVLRFNVETIFCWLKKRFREKKTRYLGWDGERTIDELDFVKEYWPEIDISKIYEARKQWLPEFMLCETAPHGSVRGENKAKMDVFFKTGTPMDLVYFQKGKRWDIGRKKTSRLW